MHDSDMERDGCWCDRCGIHHGGECPPEPDEDDAEEVNLPMDFSSSDFEVTVVKEPVADLKEILNEQIVLNLPMQPKPDKNDNGDCLKCGRSQATYLPERQEILKENPFAVLKDFKKKNES